MANPGHDIKELMAFGRDVLSNYNSAADYARENKMPENTVRARMQAYRARCYQDYCFTLVEVGKADAAIVAENVRLAKKTQKNMDINRIERKGFREYARVENAVEEYSIQIVEALKKVTAKWGKPPISPKKQTGGGVGCLHLTDIHFNERIDLPHNKYDFDIAGDRIRMHVLESMAWFKSKDINTVCVALTADMLNSDRRLDELMANADNRARATVGALDIIVQAIRELRANGFKVIVVWINGNESRIPKDRGWQDQVAGDTYDETIGRMLQLIFHSYPDDGVEIIDPQDASETVVNLAGQNVLLFHGDARMGGDVSKAVQAIVGKYARRGIAIAFALFGHIHEAFISDHFARGGSPAGDNAYSDKALNLTGKASQNSHIFMESGAIHSLKVDLQFAISNGYRTLHHFQTYHSKSEEKTRAQEVIFKVTI